MKKKSTAKKVKYAVIGLGNIAQVAVLPAFEHAENAELVALVSGDSEKLKKLGKSYKINDENLFHYKDYPECLLDIGVDAVYIAVPNHLHAAVAMDAIESGLHVLCEKPLAISVNECHEMWQAARENNVKAMTAYRLHFDKANLQVIKMAHEENKLGDLRLFNSTFTMQVTDQPNIRRGDTTLGGGPVWDIGIYCINAARSLFRDEPEEVFALAENNGDKRFKEIDEMVSVNMRFPRNRLAQFICSFGATDCSSYEIVGTSGRIRLEHAYDYAADRTLTYYKDDKVAKELKVKKSDQFAPELVYFSQCILENRDPEPSLREGLLDVRVIRAVLESLEIGRPVILDETSRRTRYPQFDQAMERPPVDKPITINVTSPTKH
jgi:glucose-fructose oxidoreductase